MPENINEVEIDYNNTDWKAIASKAIKFESELEAQGWNGCVSVGGPPQFMAEVKLEKIREFVGPIIGLAAKNDDKPMIDVCMRIVKILDGEE